LWSISYVFSLCGSTNFFELQYWIECELTGL
jgi:hypothetical protein